MASKPRKQKRSIASFLEPVAEQMVAIKKSTGKSATLAQLVPIIKRKNDDDQEVQVFKDENELGGWLASAVARMEEPNASKNGTNLHKLATIVLNRLKDTSPASAFEVASDADSKYNGVATRLGINLNADDDTDTL